MAVNFNTIKSIFSAILQGDKMIWLCITLLALLSVLTVYSSAEALANLEGMQAESFLIKHVVLLMGALILMYICHLTNYTQYARLSTILIVMAIPLLVCTLLFGETINDATRWIRIPLIDLTFQTSDFAKIALITYAARTISLMQSRAINIAELLIPVILICGLIAPADLSSAIILFFTCILLMFIGRVPIRDVLTLFVLGIGVFTILIALADYFPIIRVETWVNRLQEFITRTDAVNGEEQVQVVQAKMAIAKGGIFGVGPGNGEQAHFLPHGYSDYIFCIIIEEYGFFGALVVLVLYLSLLIRCTRWVTRSPKTFGVLLAIGLCLSIVVQAFAHMAVNVGLLPVTGLTLPFVSMGGTSLIFTGISLGIMLSVSRYAEAETKN